MIKQMVVDFCWGLMLFSTLGADFEAFVQFKESERSPGLLQDCENGYIKL